LDQNGDRTDRRGPCGFLSPRDLTLISAHGSNDAIQREMRDIKNDLKNRNLRSLLGRVARSYEEIAAEIESGVRRVFDSP
jgi:hypothetical protein